MRRLVRVTVWAALAAVVALVLLIHDGFARWSTVVYPAPRARFLTWDEVLGHPQPISVETVVTGTIDMDRCDNLDSSSPRARSCTSTAPTGPLADLAHIVVHRALGTYLVDAGFARRFADRPPYGNYSLPMQFFNRALGARNSQRGYRSAANILAERHASARAVFFTHLHPDHTSGVADLPNDLPYVFGQGEDSFLGRVAVGSHFAGKPHLEVLDYAGVAPFAPLGAAVDLLGDGSLWAIATPGHTPGHTSYLVNGAEPVLLVGDASHFRWAFEHDVPPRAMTSGDRVHAVESLAQLRRFAARYPRVRLVFGHEQ
jgi:glyoxylase-like metal-dependent hydrolase (beta-lactamase superfamily II)